MGSKPKGMSRSFNDEINLLEMQLQQMMTRISKKLEEKRREMRQLEVLKALLLHKTPNLTEKTYNPTKVSPESPIPLHFRPRAISSPTRQMGYLGNYDMSYSTGSSADTNSYWPSSAYFSPRSQVTDSSFRGEHSPCSPGCHEYSEDSSGVYQNYGSFDYGF